MLTVAQENWPPFDAFVGVRGELVVSQNCEKTRSPVSTFKHAPIQIGVQNSVDWQSASGNNSTPPDHPIRDKSSNPDRNCDFSGQAASASILDSLKPDVLTITQVASMLWCSADSVRRIPIDDLPVYDGPGRFNLYVRSDVLAYLKNRKRLRRRGSGLGGSVAPSVQPERNLADEALTKIRASS